VPQELLFSTGDLRAALDHQLRVLVEEVDSAPEQHVLQVDEGAWAAALVERYQVDAPALQPEDWSISKPEEIRVDVSHDPSRSIWGEGPALISGFRVSVHVPFTGDAGVFKMQASSFSFNPPRGSVQGHDVVKVIDYPHDASANIRGIADQFVSDLQRYLGWARSDIEAFNRTLDGQARGAISRRRERLLRLHDQVAQAGIPVRGESGGKTYIASTLVRRPAPPPLAMQPTSAPMPLEPVLADERFEHILEIVRSVGRDMERSPATYREMGEEDLRQIIVAALNTHYRGETTAEAFNLTGKTDILVRHEGRNLFIAECKVWSGAKGFSDTIDQIFRYAAWRDTKLAVVMFVRQADLSAVAEGARSALENHPQFVESRPATEETELRATMSWPGDDRRHADLNVFLVHIPPVEARRGRRQR
jgi:hypothetical protein